MSGKISLCSFCRFIPLDVDALEKLRPGARPRSAVGRSRPVRLDRSRETDLTAGDRAVFALGKAERVLSSDCPFCKITAIAVRDIKRTMGWDDLKPDTQMTLTWSHKGPSSKGVFRVNDLDNIYICFAEDKSAGLIESIQAWIANCKSFHGPECNAHNGITGPIRDTYRGLQVMRFVDVHKLCIVELREVVKYVALSYVWGAAATVRLTTMNQRQMRVPGALKGLGLPETISDAFHVTRTCGEQYLWVDALCIVQNDVEDLEAGTYAMDLIYEMSVFTIVAASGFDARHGLPGCSVGSRLPPPCIEVAPGVRLGVLTELETLIGASCYVLRGWTLQEEMLSKRILYFVDDRIFFHCPRGTMSEDCAERLRWEPNSLVRMLNPIRDYKDLVKDYSYRVLTKQNDAFRAISGIIHRISEIQQWHIVEGMPMVALENIMLFRRKQHPLSRRPAFPSYSWLGWRGDLDFMEGLYFFEGWINWHIRHPTTGEIFPIERPAVLPQLDAQDTGTRPSDKIALYRKPDVGHLPQADVQVNPAVASERRVELHPPPRFSLLCFSTLAVFFELGEMDFVKGKAEVIYVKRHRVGLGVRRIQVGTVTLDGFDEYPPARGAEFILLSKTSPSENDLEELGLDIRWASKDVYMIMLIEWIGGVAERRGIGFMDTLEVQQSMAPGPVWKDIILG